MYLCQASLRSERGKDKRENENVGNAPSLNFYYAWTWVPSGVGGEAPQAAAESIWRSQNFQRRTSVDVASSRVHNQERQHVGGIKSRVKNVNSPESFQ